MPSNQLWYASWVKALKNHWPEYLMEAGLLGIFMISACLFGTMLGHPDCPLHHWINSPLLRRFAMGLAMGATAIALIYSPWGQQSGAHLNPSVTLTFLRLKKIHLQDAVFYISAQFTGALAGVWLASIALGSWLAHSEVRYVATLPGQAGPIYAFWAELIISFVLMSVVLAASNSTRLARFTGVAAGTLVALYIIVESPISGMSMNPARSVGSAVPAGLWSFLWLYFIAPPLGMLLAGIAYVHKRGIHGVICAKLYHQNDRRCIFVCGYRRQDLKFRLKNAVRKEPIPEYLAGRIQDKLRLHGDGLSV